MYACDGHSVDPIRERRVKTWRLKIKWPTNPVGFTRETCYSEVVDVIDGICETCNPDTRNQLIALNYEIIDGFDDEENGIEGQLVPVTIEGSDEAPVQSTGEDNAAVRRAGGKNRRQRRSSRT